MSVTGDNFLAERQAIKSFDDLVDAQRKYKKREAEVEKNAAIVIGCIVVCGMIILICMLWGA